MTSNADGICGCSKRKLMEGVLSIDLTSGKQIETVDLFGVFLEFDRKKSDLLHEICELKEFKMAQA